MGQSEIVILLQCLPDEKCLPKDIFNHFVQLYRDALAGRSALCSKWFGWMIELGQILTFFVIEQMAISV